MVGLYKNCQNCIELKKVVHKDKMKLETPKINAVEISDLPREVKLGMPIEQSESKLDV